MQGGGGGHSGYVIAVIGSQSQVGIGSFLVPTGNCAERALSTEMFTIYAASLH